MSVIFGKERKYMSGKNRRKHQRLLNKTFKNLNKQIKNDELWLGRFEVVQDATYFFESERDHWQKREYPAEYYLTVYYHFVDKKTGRESKSYYDSANSLNTSNRIFLQMNDFITRECFEDTWGAAEQPTVHNAVDYRKVWAK